MMKENKNIGFYVVFFNEDYTIKKAHYTETYPKVKNIAYLLKSLEKTELSEIENLMMDVITADIYNEIQETKKIKTIKY